MTLFDLIPFLKKVREHKGWTEEDLASRADLLPQHVIVIEDGTVDPYLSQIEAMAIALELAVLAISNDEFYFVLVLPRSGAQVGVPSHKQEQHSTEPALLHEEKIDLDIALRKLHELQLQDGDLGAAYWLSIANLLRDAEGFKSRADNAGRMLEQVRQAIGNA